MTTKKDIESALMRGADTLRDTIDAANYKDYVLPVMFVKYLSDSYTDAVEELSKQYSGIRLERQKKYLPFMVAEGCSFYDLYQQRFADNIGQLMNAAMRQIEADNNQQLAGAQWITTVKMRLVPGNIKMPSSGICWRILNLWIFGRLRSKSRKGRCLQM